MADLPPDLLSSCADRLTLAVTATISTIFLACLLPFSDTDIMQFCALSQGTSLHSRQLKVFWARTVHCMRMQRYLQRQLLGEVD